MDNRKESYNASSKKSSQRRVSSIGSRVSSTANYSRRNTHRSTLGAPSNDGLSKSRNHQSSLITLSSDEEQKKVYKNLKWLNTKPQSRLKQKSRELIPDEGNDFGEDLTSWLRYLTGQVDIFQENLLTEPEKKAIIEGRRQFRIRDDQLNQALDRETRYWRDGEVEITDSDYYTHVHDTDDYQIDEGDHYEYIDYDFYVHANDGIRRLSDKLREQDTNNKQRVQGFPKLQGKHIGMQDDITDHDNSFRDMALSYHSIYSHQENLQPTPAEAERVRKQSLDYSVMMTQGEHDKLYADIVQLEASEVSMSSAERRKDNENWQNRLKNLAKRDPKTKAILKKTPDYSCPGQKEEQLNFTPTGCMTVYRDRGGKFRFKFVPNKSIANDACCRKKEDKLKYIRRCHATNTHE